MKFILHNTDIFDENIEFKLRNILESSKFKLCKEKSYRLTVSFHVNLLEDLRIDEYTIDSKLNRKIIREDKIYELLSNQIKVVENVFSSEGIEFQTTDIQGDSIEKENIIKIEINEDLSKACKNKNKKVPKIRSIIPNIQYTRETVTRITLEQLSKLFNDLIETIGDKALMCEILNIEETEDDQELFEAFCKDYRDLWYPIDNNKKLLNKLKERIIHVIKKE